MTDSQKYDIVGKGTYGCIFYPRITVCEKDNEDMDSRQYITKIQRIEKENMYEITIGEQIKKIPQYEYFFAPVIKHCTINREIIDYNLVKVCKIMQTDFGELDQSKQYTSNTIRYTGENTIWGHLNTLKENPKQWYRKLVNIHIHLLSAISKLVENKIIHFDLKQTNIMYDDIQNVPIIIDFGISRDMTSVLSQDSKMKTATASTSIANISELKKIFFSIESYDYWCIDIYIISIIVSDNWLRNRVKLYQVKQILRTFFTTAIRSIISDAERIAFHNKYIQFFQEYIDRELTWTDVLHDLLRSYNTWDNYSLATLCLLLIENAKKSGEQINKTFIKDKKTEKYQKFLKTILFSLPHERPDPETTKKTILSIFK